MVNEDILTGLKNAVDHGDSLESAVSTAISSGYNPKEVEEAAQFVGQGTLSFLQTKPEEHLVMPNKKSFFSMNSKPQPAPISSKPQPIQTKPIPTKPIQSVQSPIQAQQMPSPPITSTQEYNQIKKEISPSQNTYSVPMNNYESRTLSQEINQLSPKKPSYIKEIILGIILLILLAVLGVTILLRKELLEFFSGL